MVKLFPVVNALSHPDYTLLDKVTKVCGDSENLTNFVSDIDKKFVNIQPEYSAEDQKDLIISLIKSELKIVEDKKNTDKAEVTSLAEFNSKSMFARKRVKGRSFSYEFSRLPKSLQDELDSAIAQVLENHQA